MLIKELPYKLCIISDKRVLCRRLGGNYLN